MIFSEYWNRRIPIIAGLWIVSGATLKLASAWNDAAPMLLIWTGRWLVSIVGSLELFLSLLLFTNVMPTITKYLAICLVLCFALTHVLVLLGYFPSCSCFGTWSISSWAMLAINTAVVLHLVWYEPTSRVKLDFLKSIWYSLALVAIGFIGVTLGLREPLITANDVVSNIIDRDPVRGAISKIAILQHGNWTVVFYRPGCPDCARQEPLLIAAAEDGASDGESWCFINVGPEGQTEDRIKNCLPPNVIQFGIETDGIQTPILISLTDGRIKSSKTEPTGR